MYQEFSCNDCVQEKSKKEAEKEEREKMQFLVSNFTEEQLDRYAMYRRAAFPKVSTREQLDRYTRYRRAAFSEVQSCTFLLRKARQIRREQLHIFLMCYNAPFPKRPKMPCMYGKSTFPKNRKCCFKIKLKIE